MQQSFSRDEISHKITVRPDTRLKQYIGSTLYVNSYHHQALDQIGDGLFTLFALPLRYQDADGSPIRAVAVLDGEE